MEQVHKAEDAEIIKQMRSLQAAQRRRASGNCDVKGCAGEAILWLFNLPLTHQITGANILLDVKTCEECAAKLMPKGLK